MQSMCAHMMKGSESSAVAWSDEKRLSTRPAGVVSKKAMGDATTAPSSASCSRCAAVSPPAAKENARTCVHMPGTSVTSIQILRACPAAVKRSCPPIPAQN